MKSEDDREYGISLDEAALSVSLVSDISFEDARRQIQNVLNALIQPTAKAAEKLSKFGVLK